MPHASHGNATTLLRQASAGNDASAEQLFTLLHDELHRLAEMHLRRERVGHTLQATALIHEAWLKLVDVDSFGDAGSEAAQAQFIGYASRAMRQVLVDHARRKCAAKRGGDGAWRVTLTDVAGEGFEPGTLIDLSDAVERIAATQPALAKIAELRLFGGLAVSEIATLLGRSLTATKLDWSLARAMLSRQLDPSRG